MKRAILLSACAVSVAALSGCSSDGPKPNTSGDPREGRASSVGDGLSATPPKMGSTVEKAAADAGCTVKGWPADLKVTNAAGAAPGGRTHDETPLTYTVSIPPTSGAHSGVWAHWGFYDQAVPYSHVVHNMEHGGVIVHYGSGVSAANIEALKTFWRDEPAYVIVTPDGSPSFPKDGVVVTSWQRWMVCKPFKASQVAALKTYRDTFRGAGPENIKGDTGLSRNTSANAPGLPTPLLPDPRA